MTAKGSSGLRAILIVFIGGLIAGAFDITYAFIYYGARYGATPVRILQAVASGALGRASFSGGAKSAALGAFFHFFIAVTAAFIYFLASRILAVLINHAVIGGILYGLGIYLVMNFIVLPLSRVNPSSPAKLTWITGVLVHMFLIGLSISLSVRAASRPTPS